MHLLPPIYDWMSEDEVSFRQKAEGSFLEAVKKAGYSGITSYETIQEGHSSVVYKFVHEGQAKVCKLADHDAFSRDVLFYSACARQRIHALTVDANVQVRDDLYACFMNFVDVPTLAEVSEETLLEEGKFFQLGAIAASLHQIQGKGFGLLKPKEHLEGVFPDFQLMIRRKIFHPDLLRALEGYVEVDEVHAVDHALKYLNTFFEKGNMARLCHGDLNVTNIFNTEPLTIFDPGPAHLSHPMLDLGLAIVYAAPSEFYDSIRNQLVEGYKTVAPIDEEELRAGIVVNAYRKLGTVIRKKHHRKMEVYKKLLREEL